MRRRNVIRVTWHMTWHMTNATWHVTHDAWHFAQGDKVAKFQVSSSHGLGVMTFWRLGEKGSVDEGIYVLRTKVFVRTAQATPGLLKNILWPHSSMTMLRNSFKSLYIVVFTHPKLWHLKLGIKKSILCKFFLTSHLLWKFILQAWQC